jgi:predicted MFS family arabinose efflux permease
VSSPKYSRQAIICSIFAYAFLLLGMVLASTTFLLVLLFTLSGFVIGVASTLLTVKISNSAPDDIQGEVLGVQIALRVLGDAIICLFGGVLLLFSSSYILIGAAFMSIAAIVHYILRYRSF